MADLVVLLGVLAFFAVSVLYVIGLDRLVGPDDAAGDVADDAGRAEADTFADAAR